MEEDISLDYQSFHTVDVCTGLPGHSMYRFHTVRARRWDVARRNSDAAAWWLCGVGSGLSGWTAFRRNPGAAEYCLGYNLPRKRPLWLDGVQAQPRRPLSTASATTSLGELHLPPAPLLRLLSGTWPWLPKTRFAGSTTRSQRFGLSGRWIEPLDVIWTVGSRYGGTSAVVLGR